MSDLISEPVQEPPDVTNLGPPSSVEAVSDGVVGSCFDSPKTNEAVPSTILPDLECIKSEQDALKSQECVVAADSSVNKGVI